MPATTAAQRGDFSAIPWAQNLADTRYVTSGAGLAFFAGPPRRVALSATTSF